MLYVQSNQAELIKKEIALLNETFKGRITVGDSRVSFWGNFPDLSIKIYDVKIFETKAHNAPIIMDVKDLYVGLNLWDLTGGNYDIQSILIRNGVFNIVIHPDNTSNLQNSLATASESSGATTNIHLKKIRLKNLDVHTLDEATNTDVEKFVYEGQGDPGGKEVGRGRHGNSVLL